MSFECRNLDTVIPAPTNFTIVRNTESKPLTFLAGIFSTLNNDADFTEEKCETKEQTKADVRKANSCNLCRKSFLSERKLEKHKGAHTRVEICSKCGKGVLPNSMRFHMKVHERKTDENLSCTICSKTLSTKKFFELHMEAHAHAQPKTCDQCGKIVNSHMKEHLKSHTTTKPYKCSHCDYACYKEINLEKHITLHESNENLVHKCQICHYLTADVTNMRKHTKTHSPEKTHKCDFCDYKSDTQRKIMIHIKRKHKEVNSYDLLGKVGTN